MPRLIKHMIRISFAQRMTALVATVAINLFFIIWNAFDPNNLALNIVAVSLSGCSLAALFIVQVISDATINRSLFKSPVGYMTQLTPTPGWKLLLSQTIAIVIPDVIGLFVGITGVTYLSLKLGQVDSQVYRYFDVQTVVWGLIFFTLFYLLISLAICFARALRASVFYKLRFKGLLSLLSALAALYVLHFADLLVAPFGYLTSYGTLFSISVGYGFNAGTIAYMLVMLLKSAALFFVTSHLIERKINL